LSGAAALHVGVRLDEAHRYWAENGRELDGCTSTLKSVGLIDASHYTEEARLRGTYVHEMVHMDLDGDLDDTTIDPDLGGYLDAARAYVRDVNLSVLHVELPLGCLVRGIAGKPDVIGKIGTRDTLVDWKTGSYEPWHRYQSAWYEHLARVNGFVSGLVDRVVVYLAADGTYQPKPFKERIDWQIAQAAITVVQAKRLR